MVVAAMASRLSTSTTASSVREGTLLCSVILVGFLFSAAGIPAATCKALAACESSQSSLRPTRVDTNLLELYARAWSARWEDRTKADAFVAAMGRIREEMVRQYEDDLERRIRERAERRMRGEYGSDYDEEDY